jgi:hypothetical protein
LRTTQARRRSNDAGGNILDDIRVLLGCEGLSAAIVRLDFGIDHRAVAIGILWLHGRHGLRIAAGVGALPDAGGACLTDGRLTMGQLMLRCPMTDRNFSTGIDTESETLALVPDTTITARSLPLLRARALIEASRRLARRSVPRSEQIASVR